MPNSYNKYHYHITTYENALKILDTGYIDPRKSTGRQNVTWYVSRSKVTWAIAHVCMRHQVTLDKIAILTVLNEHINMKNSNRKGIYFSRARLQPSEMTSASMWMQREEQYVFIPGVRGKRTYRSVTDDE